MSQGGHRPTPSLAPTISIAPHNINSAYSPRTSVVCHFWRASCPLNRLRRPSGRDSTVPLGPWGFLELSETGGRDYAESISLMVMP